MTQTVSYTIEKVRDRRVARICIDNPPVNATSQVVRKDLLEACQTTLNDDCSHGLICCAGKTFIAGGDVTEFGSEPMPPDLPDVYKALEESPVIWGVFMQGSVFGGGLELALSCDIRVADDATIFGFPEVKLGLVPGAGGTQRLPRLVSLSLAANMLTTGDSISARAFHAEGGLDAVLDKTPDNIENENATLDILLAVSEKRLPVSKRNTQVPNSDFFETSRTSVIKRAKGAAAPLHNLDAVEWATSTDFKEGQKRERALHLKLRNSEESNALRHVFFAERRVTRPAHLKDVEPKPFQQIAVIGGGLMGSGIAVACLMAELDVLLIESSDVSAQSALQKIRDLLSASVQRKKLDEAKSIALLKRLTVGTEFKKLHSADIIIEAVFEDLAVKKEVFNHIAAHAKPHAIVATNTSYLDPRDLATVGIDNGNLLGLHFFSPANIMKLLEIIQTPSTDPAVLATAFQFARKINKTGVLSGICDGFIGNRMLAAYRRQADYLLADGAVPEFIDQAMRDFGMPMGPYELQDLTGLQIAWANRKRLADRRPPQERYISIADQLCEQGRFGQRSAKGWYRYDKNSRKPVPDSHVTELIHEYSERNGINRNAFTQQTVQERLLAVLANEGARIVEEKIAEADRDVDIVKILGYGFPRWRGGPMHYASTLGHKQIGDILQSVAEQSPDSWVIANRYQESSL